LPVEIIGFNLAGSGQNTAMFSLKSLSWARDASSGALAAALAAGYRDVVILDPLNQKVGSYNLTSNNLADAAKKAALKALLTGAANPVDSDRDRLPDYWETWAFGGLQVAADTRALDGLMGWQHYAQGTRPFSVGREPLSLRPSAPWMEVVADVRRGRPHGLVMAAEFSVNLRSWTSIGYEALPTVPLYDGSGRERRVWRSGPSMPAAAPFARLRLTTGP
jgi:hypothetical protein